MHPISAMAIGTIGSIAARFLGGAFVLCIAGMLYVALRSRLGPLVWVQATLVRKRMTTYDPERRCNWGGRINPGIDELLDLIRTYRGRGLAVCTFYLVFCTPDGREQEFKAPESVYTALCAGDEGVLVYRGEVFRGFTRSSQPVPPSVRR